MYEGLKHAHSGLRWLAVIMLVLVIIQAFTGKSNSKTSLWTMSLVHIQIVLGLILYFFVSPITKNLAFDMKDAIQRFYGLEHVALMVLVAIFVTAGHSALKKGKNTRSKWLYVASFIIMMAGIPWPFRIPSAGWF